MCALVWVQTPAAILLCLAAAFVKVVVTAIVAYGLQLLSER